MGTKWCNHWSDDIWPSWCMIMVWFYGFQIKFCQRYFHFSFSGESERSNLAHIFPQHTNTPVNIQTSDHTGLNLELRHCKPHWVSWSSLSPCVCHSQFHTLWFSDSSPPSLFPSLSLSRSFCLSLRLTAGLGLHFHTCLIGCSPWAAVESPPAASDRQRQSCLGQTCLLLFPPPPQCVSLDRSQPENGLGAWVSV